MEIAARLRLLEFIEAIEQELKIKATKHFLPMQAGDVESNWADVSLLSAHYDYHSQTSIKSGVHNFIKWFKAYYKKK